LGDRQRVVVPGAIDRGRRQHDDALYTRAPGRFQHAPRALHVLGLRRLAGAGRADLPCRVHERVAVLEDRLEVVDGQIDEVEPQLGERSDRRAAIEADDLVDVGVVLQARKHPMPDPTRDPRYDYRPHPPTMAAMSGSGPPEGFNPFEGM